MNYDIVNRERTIRILASRVGGMSEDCDGSCSMYSAVGMRIRTPEDAKRELQEAEQILEYITS